MHIIWKNLIYDERYTLSMTPETNSIFMIIKLEYIILLFLILLKSFDVNRYVHSHARE